MSFKCASYNALFVKQFAQGLDLDLNRAHALKGQRKEKSKRELCAEINKVIDEEGRWPIERVLETRVLDDGSEQARVKWLGFEETAWEPRENVQFSIAKDERQAEAQTENGENLPTVYVGRLIRAKPAPVVPGVTKTVNVTSGSQNKFGGKQARFDFSPLFLAPVNEPRAKTVEGFWQGGKVYPQLGHLNANGQLTDKWRAFRDAEYAYMKGDPPKGRRRPPSIKSKNFVVGEDGKRHWKNHIPVFAVYDRDEQKRLDYIDARKQAYVPTYYDSVIQTDSFKALKKLVDDGEETVMLLDYDGPRNESGYVKIDVPTLVRLINDPSAPFGHAYVLAAALLGIEKEQFTQ